MDSGLLVINKPSGMTSFRIVSQVRRILGVKKVGHCGTLDPMATGILLVLFGSATKKQRDYMTGKKVYRARVLGGTITDTGDITGTVQEQRECGPLSVEAVTCAAEGFVGIIEQIPPMYSALKYGGRKLYEFARRGETVPRMPREVTIDYIEVLSAQEKHFEVRVQCSAGTYIRTLAEDIGQRLGCGATLEGLCRERVGDYGLDDALEGAQLEQCSREDLLKCRIEI